MSLIAPQIEDRDEAAEESAGATARTFDLEQRKLSRAIWIRKYLISTAVWFLYVPHYAILWLLGPRYGITWVRFAANVHWLLSFLGAQRPARRSLEKLYPYLGTKLTISQILRRHLLLKHECFARVRVYNLHGANSRLNDIEWRANPSCLSAIPQMNAREHGLVIVGYHFGFFQLSAKALSQVVPDCDPVQLRFRIAACVEQAMSPIARLVMRRAIDADQRSGARIFYFDSETSLRQLYRLLRKADSLAVAADGTLGDDFIEAPFFDGTLRVPVGWARLAAATSSDVLLLYDTEIDRHHREGWFFNHVRCSNTSNESVERAVAEAVRTLEAAIQREPWGWHPWQRLRWQQNADGKPRYYLKQFGADAIADAKRMEALDEHADRTQRKTETVQPQRRTRELSRSTNVRKVLSSSSTNGFGDSMSDHSPRPRVAIVCNSLTPYRIHLHERIVDEVPEIELWSLTTHANAYDRWTEEQPPGTIRPIDFGHGEPSNEQAKKRFAVREWRKGGRIIKWLDECGISAVLCQGCGDMGRQRILSHCNRVGIPCFLYGDFNICGDRLVGPKRLLKKLIYSRAIRSSTGLMPCGVLGKELFARYGGGNKPQFLFPFVPDVRVFENPAADAVEEVRRRFDLGRDRRRLVFSARMMQDKRPDLAIEAFAAIAEERPEWDLLMLGDGVLRDSLESTVPAHLRERIRWIGFLHNVREVASLYALCDALLLPSSREPWGVVVVEAAAAGMAIVASDVVGSAPELVQDDCNGYRFAAGDLQSLITALRRCTSAEWIDKGKQQSRAVLREWLADADPVASFRAALDSCGLVPTEQSEHVTTAQFKSAFSADRVMTPK